MHIGNAECQQKTNEINRCYQNISIANTQDSKYAGAVPSPEVVYLGPTMIEGPSLPPSGLIDRHGVGSVYSFVDGHVTWLNIYWLYGNLSLFTQDPND